MILCETTSYDAGREALVPRFLPPSWLDYIGKAQNGEARARRTAELLLLFTMCARLGLTPPELTVLEGGKPDFVGSPYHIGITNGEGFVAVAIADAPIGLDMEPYVAQPEERIRRLSAIFSEGEQQALAAAGRDKNDRFIEIWVKKEALCKVHGRGLTALRTVSADTAAAPPHFEARVRDANKFRYYYIAAYLAG